MSIKNYDNPSTTPVETWDTTQLQEDFEVLGFAAPYVVVRRKSDNKKGSLEFKHRPRVYFGFVPDQDGQE